MLVRGRGNIDVKAVVSNVLFDALQTVSHREIFLVVKAGKTTITNEPCYHSSAGKSSGRKRVPLINMHKFQYADVCEGIGLF